jgi:polyhydroxyalkanoate synthase
MNDLLLSEEEITDSIAGPDPTALPSLRECIATGLLVLEQGAATGREAATLGAELIRIGLGRSDLEPARDSRFRDPTWSENPLYHRLAQSYLAACQSADNLVTGVEQKSWSHAETARFLSSIATSTVAPTNTLLGNPAALKRAFETGGKSLLRGFTNWVTDLQRNGGMPAMAKKGQFTVGVDLAVTPGAVVARGDVGELIQYKPSTPSVYERPTLVIPPPIGRYYFLDLAPGRSFVEHAVNRGIQTFMLSWRNPTRREAAWGIDEYAQRVLDAIDEVREIAGQDEVNLVGFCAGGIISTIALNALAARGEQKVASASYAVTLLDWGGANPVNVFSSRAVRTLARWNSRRKGIIDARTMGGAFTWMRPDDLVWKYWVNNYLLGEDPPPFDILAWNADGTNLPAKLHAELLDIFGNNPLPSAEARTYLDAKIDLSSIMQPNFVIGAVNDHLTPWRGTYRTTELMGGETTYVLSNAGHIAALVNPPSNPKASYFTGVGAGSVDASTWRRSAIEQQGSWWDAWADWTIGHSGAEVAAPTALGSQAHPMLADAPGTFVRDEA